MAKLTKPWIYVLPGYPQPRKSLQHVLWNYTSQWKRSATTPNPAWPCNTALPNGTLAIRCLFSYLQRASFSSTSQWKRWWQTLQQSLCPWTWFYHRWSSSTQWHRTDCSTMFPSYQHDLATQCVCVYHQVCMCVCVGQVVWFEFVRTSQQLNAPFCNQFLHLCMYHPVCMSVCVCVSSARLCGLSLSELVSN